MARKRTPPIEQFPLGLELLHTLCGHRSTIYSIVWSPDGRMLASASADKTIHLWDGQSGELHQMLKGHSGDVFNVAWSPDSRMLASGLWDKTIRLWDAQSGELLRILRHKGTVSSMAWSPDGWMFASGTGDKKIYLCNARNDELYHTFEGHSDGVTSLTWSPDGQTFASGSDDQTICLWDAHTGKLQRILKGHYGGITSLTWSSDGRILASGSWDETIRLWNAQSGKLLRTFEGYYGSINTVAWSPDGRMLASSSWDETIHIWNVEISRQVSVLEGHTDRILCVRFSSDGRLLASKSADNTVRLWRCDNWGLVAVLNEPSTSTFGGLAFHPHDAILATRGERKHIIRIWRLDYKVLTRIATPSEMRHYRNAKVVLVGDTSVGKSGLGLVLTDQPWKPTESSHGRHVWMFDSFEVTLPDGRSESREILLWDLAGQPGYRMIHQLYLNDVAVALVVFDARSETEPFAGVRHWNRALRQAQYRRGDLTAPLTKYLVAARTDRGGISVSRERIDATVSELNFDGFFETSAKEGWQISELIAAIRDGIDWDCLPIVSSTKLFQAIKRFLVDEKRIGRLLSTTDNLYQSFCQTYPELASDDNLRAKFETCIGRVECRGLIRRLSFGRLVLLQPELLDAYASAMVNAAKGEPDGLGSIPEEDALNGSFMMSAEERVADKDQEKLILTATVEELLRHELVFKEVTEEGTDLVFPSQFTRERSDALDVPGKAIIFTFEGPLLNIYATLAVRLSHSHLFKKRAMWKNAATFTAAVGGTYGIYLREIEEGRGELTLFFDKQAGKETRCLFEEYIRTHLQRRALPESIRWRRIVICPICNTPISELQAQKRLDRGKNWIICNVCDTRLSLFEREEGVEVTPTSAVATIDRLADEKRDSDASLISARGEISTQDFRTWAGSTQITLATVFTDVVESTKLGVELGDETMNEVRRNHFTKVRELIAKYEGYEIKNIGDAFFVTFRTAVQAFDFALTLSRDTGDKRIKIRAGIHVGPIIIEENDAFGSTVNYTDRVIKMAAGKDDIWVSNQAREHINQFIPARHPEFKWIMHTNCELKGFPGKHTLWSVALA